MSCDGDRNFLQPVVIFLQPVGFVVTDIANGAGGRGTILGPVESDSGPPSARHHCDVSSELCYPGAKLRRWTRHSLHASAKYREYNENLMIFLLANLVCAKIVIYIQNNFVWK